MSCFTEIEYPTFSGFSGGSGQEGDLYFTTGASSMVADAWSKWKTEAAYYGQKMECLVDTVYSIDPQFEVFDVDLDTSNLSGLYTPTKPDAPEDPDPSLFNVNDPGLADPYSVLWENPTEISFTATRTVPSIDYDFNGLPAFNVDEPSPAIDLNLPTAPDAFTDTIPEDENTYEIGDAPDVYTIVPPLVPTVEALTFTATPPSEIEINPLEITYSESDYTSTLLTELNTTAYNWLQGGTGVPENIWNLIWDNARENEEFASQKLLKEATEEWSGRGFTLNSGILDQKLRDIRLETSKKTSELNRTQAIEYYKAETDNIRHALAQGIALEGVLIDSFNKKQERLVRIEELSVQVYSTFTNAKVNVLGANIELYKAKADVYRAQLEAEKQKIDIYKAQIDAQVALLEGSKVETEIYQTQASVLKTKADIYNSVVNAYNAKVNAYNSQINAYKAGVEAEIARLEETKVEVEIYSNRVEAYKAQVDAYGSKMQAQNYKSEVFLNAVKAYEADVSAWGSRQNIAVQIADSKNKVNEVLSTNYQSQVSAFTARLQGEVERIRAIASLYDTLAKNYETETAGEKLMADSTATIYAAEVNLRVKSAEVQLQKAAQNITQMIEEAKILSDNAKAAAEVYSTIGAATLSGVSMSAALQDAGYNNYSRGNDTNTNINKNYTCEGAC